jgi:hypothetical protein
MTENNILHCANHPTVETTLRCNRCDKPICPKCAVKSPVGYRCRECVKSQLKIFDTAVWYDYISAFVVAGIASAVASIVVSLIAGFFFGLLVLAFSPFAGQIIARTIQFAIKNRRSRNLFYTAVAGVVLGAAPIMLSNLAGLLFASQYGGFSIWGVLPLVWQVVYLVMAVPTVYAQLSGIQLFK